MIIFFDRRLCVFNDRINRIFSDPLGPYISLVNNSIDQITPFWSTLINYPYPHIDLLIKDRFNPIDRSSC